MASTAAESANGECCGTAAEPAGRTNHPAVINKPTPTLAASHAVRDFITKQVTLHGGATCGTPTSVPNPPTNGAATEVNGEPLSQWRRSSGSVREASAITACRRTTCAVHRLPRPVGLQSGMVMGGNG